MRSDMTRRSFMAVGAVGALSLGAALAGCSSQTSGSTTPKPKKLTSARNLTIMSNTAEVTAAYLKEFEQQHPEYNVSFLTYDETRLRAMFNAGQPPDYVRFQDASQLANFMALGLARPLDDLLDAGSSKIRRSDLLPVCNQLRWNGKTQGTGPYYAIPHGWECDFQLWINTQVFDQANIPYPSQTVPMTYNQLLELAKRLTVRKNGSIQIYGLDPGWDYWQQPMFQNALAGFGSSMWSSDLSKAQLNTAHARTVFKWYVDWAQAHVGPSPADPSAVASINLYNANRVAIAQQGFWFEGWLKDNAPAVYPHSMMIPAPKMGPKRFDGSLSGAGGWIPVAAKNQEGAWKFMEYYITGTPGHDRAKSGWGIPGLKSLVPMVPQSTAQDKAVLQSFQREEKYLGIFQSSPYVADAAVGSAIDQAIDPVMQGKGDLDSALQQLAGKLNNLSQTGKRTVEAQHG